MSGCRNDAVLPRWGARKGGTVLLLYDAVPLLKDEELLAACWLRVRSGRVELELHALSDEEQKAHQLPALITFR